MELEALICLSPSREGPEKQGKTPLDGSETWAALISSDNTAWLGDQNSVLAVQLFHKCKIYSFFFTMVRKGETAIL